MDNRNQLVKQWQMGLFYLCVAGFSFGISAQETLLLALLLFQMAYAMIYGRRPAALLGQGRRLAFVFMTTLTLAAVAAQQLLGDEGQTRIHWALIAFWAFSPSMTSRLNPITLYRTLLCASLPGMIYSFIQVCRPDEIAKSLEIGFQAYPKPEGFLSNPMTFVEGLVALSCWSLARLSGSPGKRERLAILAHLCISVIFIALVRDFAGLVILGLVLLASVFLLPGSRKAAMGLMVFCALVVSVIHPIFGINARSLDTWPELNRNALTLIRQHPLVGIGPNKFPDHPVPGSALNRAPTNTPMGIMGEAGLLGLTTYLVFMGAVAVAAVRLIRRHKDPLDPLYWPGRCLLLVFLVWWLFGMVIYNFANSRLLIFHALHWALILQLGERTTEVRE